MGDVTSVEIAGISIGRGAPLVLISGLNVIENSDATLACAAAVQAAAESRDLPLIFKASFDKANRSDRDSYRGPGIDLGLEILARVKAETGLPVTTDVHEPNQAKRVADVVDCLQIPAFLCRQTDLVRACAETGLPLNIKRAQFVAPADMALAVEKARAFAKGFGNGGVLLTERGSTFGYNDLVVDMRGLVAMRAVAPIGFDATHAAQLPGAGAKASGGNRNFVAPLARAAVAVGIDALFVEVHPQPDQALCDPACQITGPDLELLLDEVCAIRAAVDATVRS
jgi:2-dehydro-3-deoxyphosphooctonate aldolase (KDO 8-P synthase)